MNQIKKNVILDSVDKSRIAKIGELRVVGCIFLVVLFVLTAVASAETGGFSTNRDSSAGAIASANGDETITKSHAMINDNMAKASAFAKAKASNGRAATVVAEAWANFLDKATAYSKATSTATSQEGETVWVVASAEVSTTEDGTSVSKAGSYVCLSLDCPKIDVGNNENDKDKSVKTSSSRPGTGGAMYTFGNSDIERYCYFKQQLNDDDQSNDERAKYYIGILTWDNGFLHTEDFERKYDIVCTSDNINLDMRDRIR